MKIPVLLFFLSDVATRIISGTSVIKSEPILPGYCAAAEVKYVSNLRLSKVTSRDWINTASSKKINDGLIMRPKVGAGYVEIKVCNVTAAPITPGATKINWVVYRRKD